MSDEKIVLEPVPETDEQKVILGKMTCLGNLNLPTEHLKNCQHLWEAFNLGREFEREGQYT